MFASSLKTKASDYNINSEGGATEDLAKKAGLHREGGEVREGNDLLLAICRIGAIAM
jgi:hypothetical protein